MVDEKHMQIALEMKEEFVNKIEEYQKEIEKLERNMELLDTIIKQSSFTKASSLLGKKSTQDKDEKVVAITSGNNVVANAHITEKNMIIKLLPEIHLNQNVPPFKTFFLDRIIKEMQEKDVRDGNTKSIECIINDENDSIKEIVIKNYHSEEREKEIINATSWVLSKMMENDKRNG